MALLAKKKYTYDDYSELPEGAPYQLINGELVMSPAPTPYHQDISRELEFILHSFVKKNDLGKVYYAPIDIYLSEEDTFQPDIIFISKNRLNIIGEKKIEGQPDLIIEILSPSTAYYDLKEKKKKYELHGVKEYWIVDPLDKSIEVFENKNKAFVIFSKQSEQGKIQSKLIPGFEFEIKEIFEV